MVLCPNLHAYGDAQNNIPLVSVELMGYHMGLTVPKEGLKYFWNGRTGPRPSSGYGTQSCKPQYGTNAVFKKLKIPLRMSWLLINKFKNIEEFSTYLSTVSEKDVLVCYDWPTLFDQKNKGNWGHVCVLDKVYIDKNEARIIDPEHDVPKWRVVTINKLYEAMKTHGEKNNGGFWEFTVTKT